MARSVRSRIGTRSEHNRLLISDGRRSLWTRSIQTLDQMQASHIQPDAFTCSSAISSCEKGAWQIALRCFSSLCKSVLPNAVVQLASGCCMRGESFRPTGSTPWAVWLSEVELRYTTLMMAFSRYGEWRQALDLFRCLVAENVQMDLVLHGAAVKACEEGSQWQEALCILQRLARTALVPDTTLLNSAISACEKAEEWPWAPPLAPDTLGLGGHLDLASSFGFCTYFHRGCFCWLRRLRSCVPMPFLTVPRSVLARKPGSGSRHCSFLTMSSAVRWNWTSSFAMPLSAAAPRVPWLSAPKPLSASR